MNKQNNYKISDKNSAFLNPKILNFLQIYSKLDKL